MIRKKAARPGTGTSAFACQGSAGTDISVMMFLASMAVTALNMETKAIYLNLIDGERKWRPMNGGNKNESKC